MGSVADLNPTALCGQWLMDKKLSDDIGPILKIQGLGWLMRKAICAATIIVTFALHQDEPSSDKYLTFDQTLKGIYTLHEKRILDWTEHDHSDDVFGAVIIRSRLLSGVKGEDGKIYPDFELQTTLAENIQAESDAKNYLREGISPSGKIQKLGRRENLFLHDFIRSKTGGWTMEQIWGVEAIDGQPCISRHAVVAKGSSFEFRRCVYGLMAQQDSA